jgi:membrane protease YdiL (CAAX protease family)
MSRESRNLLLFFVFTLLATYITYFAIVLAGWSPFEAPGLFLFLIGGSAPSWVGILFVLFTFDREQRREYFQRLLPRLIPGRWWAIILLVFPLLFAIVYALELLLGGSLPGMELLKAYIAQPSMLPLAILLGLGSGPIPEEFGWRGYALDPLIRRFGRIPGSLILAVIWGVWHLGLFFMPQTWHGQLGFRFAGFITFMLATVGLTLLMTWVHVNTHGSILAAILMHLMNNQTSTLLAPHPDRVEILRMAVLLVLGLAVCLWMERKPLRRGTAALAQP